MRLHTYRVTWEMDIDATSAREAAQDALAVHRNARSSAVVFDVFDEAGAVERVDLFDEVSDAACKVG